MYNGSELGGQARQRRPSAPKFYSALSGQTFIKSETPALVRLSLPGRDTRPQRELARPRPCSCGLPRGSGARRQAPGPRRRERAVCFYFCAVHRPAAHHRFTVHRPNTPPRRPPPCQPPHFAAIAVRTDRSLTAAAPQSRRLAPTRASVHLNRI